MHVYPRILFINRMASMVRGGGETFDLEIARHLAAMGCRVTFLTGIPMFGKALLGPEDWWGGETRDQRPESKDQRLETRACGSFSDLDVRFEQGTQKSEDDSQAPCITKSVVYGLRSLVFFLRSPYTGWFPWDKTPGGWRLRIADFKMFEYRAAQWAWRHQDEFDVIQVCELPFFVRYFKRLEKVSGWKAHQARSTKHEARSTKHIPIVIRLTAPDFYDPVGGVQAADAAIASGDTMRKIRAGARPDCHDIPNGVDVEKFQVSGFRFQERDSLFRQRHNIPPDAVVISHVARFQSVKNHAMLVDAFTMLVEKVPNSRLVLAGSGPLTGDIEVRCQKSGIRDRVIFLGEVKHADLPEVYQAADINVMPSDYESFCFAVLEGMASGLPHVVTDTNWVPGLIGYPRSEVGDQRPDARCQTSDLRPQASDIRTAPGGLITPIGDASSFAEALLMLARDPGLRSEMGRWNRTRAEKEFTWNASAAKLLSVYHGLTNQIA